jgi:hypothetical protein
VKCEGWYPTDEEESGVGTRTPIVDGTEVCSCQVAAGLVGSQQEVTSYGHSTLSLCSDTVFRYVTQTTTGLRVRIYAFNANAFVYSDSLCSSILRL